MAVVKLNGASKATNAPTQENTIDYDDAVREAKEIIAARDRDEWLLGELADKIEPKYGERTLARFAKDIGIAPCTLERHRSVWRAWAEIPEPAPKSFPFAVAMALQNHPDRAEIVRQNPKLSRRDARQHMRSYQGQRKQAAIDADPRPAEEKSADYGQRTHILAANTATRAAQNARQWLENPDNLASELGATASREAAAAWTKAAELWEQRKSPPPELPCGDAPPLLAEVTEPEPEPEPARV